MEKFQRYYLSFLLLIVYTNTIAQVNCNAIEGEDCKKACELYNWASELQDTRGSQGYADQRIKLSSDLIEGYIEKGIPYFKSGNFFTRKIAINRAIDLVSENILGYKSWGQFQFQGDYNRVIRDFEILRKYYPEEPVRSQNRTGNPGIVKAISYRGFEQNEKITGIIDMQFAVRACVKGTSDHDQPGLAFCEQGKYDKALENFEKQRKAYNFAGNIYFKSKVSKIRNKDYLDLKALALQTYDEAKTMKDGYTHYLNNVYRA
ncbi:hypothetical protein [Chryseobacterium sp.]|uniref:hypothetical protein n=1 Tax=Chryseobacterium sp. TaxID=1871047 RepID=UPI0025B99B16|nr:hypothetical protein [Chryseobacterium sp.]MBV8325974.1 hypothetical protein [Chryseobacterium sp.]